MSKIDLLSDIVFNESHLAWWEFDVINNIVMANDLKITMLGYDPADFKGKGYQAFTDLVHPDDYEQCMEAMRKVLSGVKDIYQTDYRIRDSAQSYHWYMDRGVVIERLGDGKVKRLRGIVIDLGKEYDLNKNTETVVGLLKQNYDDQNAMIIVCSSCQRIRMKDHQWVTITPSLNMVIRDAVSHGICPECVRSLYPEIAEKILAKR